MSFNAPQAIPPTPAPSGEFYTNYSQFAEIKNFTDGTVVIEGGYIHNLRDPIGNLDAVNKQWALENSSGDPGALKSWKNAVNAASTGNISSLSGIQTIDGVLLEVDYRILVKDQNTPSENGLYLISSGAWTRTVDASTESVASGTAVYVMAGSANINKVYVCYTTSGAPSYETVNFGTAITFTPFGVSTPGGLNQQVQFNSSGVLDGSPNLTWDGNQLKTIALQTNSIQPLTTSDANVYTDSEAPIIIGNLSSATVAVSELSNSGTFLMGNQAANKISMTGTNRVSGTGASMSFTTGSGSLGGSLYLGTGATTVGAGPPIVLRPGSGTTTQGNVVVNPVTPSSTVNATTGSLVVFGGIGTTGSLYVNGTLTGTQLLPSAQLFVGSSTGVATARTMSGDVSMDNTGVTTLATITTAGTYSTANITVDAKGRVTAASSGSGAGSGGSNGALQYNNSGAFGGLANFSSGGSNITGNTSAQLAINNSSGLTGSTGPLSVAGAAFIGGSLIVGGTISPNLPLVSSKIFVGGGSNIASAVDMSGDATIGNTGVLALSTTGVVAGTYTNTNITVDSKGRITAAANGSGGSGGTPGGSTGQLQYNNTGSFGGMSGWLYSTASGLSLINGTAPNTSMYIGGTAEAALGGTLASLRVAGGATFAKDVYIGGSTLTPGQISLQVTGTAFIDGLRITSATDSTSEVNGALRVIGGAGIGGSLNVGGTINGRRILPSGQIFVGSSTNYATNATMSGDASMSNTGALTLTSVFTAGTVSNALLQVDAKGRIIAATNGVAGVPGGMILVDGTDTGLGTFNGGSLQYNAGNGVFGGLKGWAGGYLTTPGSTVAVLLATIEAGITSTQFIPDRIFSRGTITAFSTSPTAFNTIGGASISGNVAINGSLGVLGDGSFGNLLSATNILATNATLTTVNTVGIVATNAVLVNSTISSAVINNITSLTVTGTLNSNTIIATNLTISNISVPGTMTTNTIIATSAGFVNETAVNSIISGTMSANVARVTSALDVTNSTTAALVVSGGVGIAKHVIIAGTAVAITTPGSIAVGNTVSATALQANTFVSTAAGLAITTTGSIQVGATITSVNELVTGATDSVSTTSGALIVSGGAGILKNVTIGGSVTVTGNLTSAGNVSGVSFITTSDKRKKDNIQPLGIIPIDGITGYKYNIKGQTETNYGFIAQELLSNGFDDLVTQDSEGFYSVNYTSVIPILVESVKESRREMEKLRDEINVLKALIKM